MKTAAKLYFVATPIGNLNDLSPRAKKILTEAEVIAAESKTRARKLLAFVKRKTSPLIIRYRQDNAPQQTTRILKFLTHGKTVALISDAGTPLIADPGRYLLNEAIARKIDFTVIPGPSAFLTALIYSGFDSQRFLFLGYFPRQPKRQRRLLRQLSKLERKLVKTLIFYETPHRLGKTLTILSQFCPRARLVIARELTKRFATIYRGRVVELKEMLTKEKKLKGEFTLVLEKR